MYSSEDLERFYFKYQTEALPHGQSLQSFCLSNKVPCNFFSKWYGDSRCKVVAVQVDDRPLESSAEESEQSIQVAPRHPSLKVTQATQEGNVSGNVVRIWVELHMSNGVYLLRKKLSYRLEAKSLLIDLRQHLDLELSRTEELRSGYLTEAINYLNHFWNELTAYVQYGAFPIDNNAAERAVRCMTTARNNSFHFGSDLGAQMSATYHSIISTVKLHGSSVWSYLGKFFTKVFEGRRDYSSLMPSCIGFE